MATYYIGGMVVSDSLAHARPKGALNKDHKYIDKIAIGGGQYRYVYNEPGNSRAARRSASDVAAIRSRFSSSVSSDRRASGNVSTAARRAYGAAYRLGRSDVARRALAADRSRVQATGAVTAKAINTYTKGKKAFNQGVASVKSAASDARSWATRKMDWASDQVRKGLGSARRFIHDLLRKIGVAAGNAKRWLVGGTTYTQRGSSQIAYKTTGPLGRVKETGLVTNQLQIKRKAQRKGRASSY